MQYFCGTVRANLEVKNKAGSTPLIVAAQRPDNVVMVKVRTACSLFEEKNPCDGNDENVDIINTTEVKWACVCRRERDEHEPWGQTHREKMRLRGIRS